jgi:calcium-dependent protein kinase
MPLDSVVLKRMKEFCTMSKMKKAAVFAAARYLRPEEIQGLQELFKSFDTNNDGVISLDELRAGLREHSTGMKITDDEVRFVLQEADIGGSGDIDYSEFIAATVNLALLEREDVMAKLFEEIDLDHSGTLTVEEIEAALARVVPDGVQHQQVLEFVRMADTNGDGVIDFEEFKALWQRLNRGDVANAAKSFKKISASML